MVFILSKIKCFFRLLQSAALQIGSGYKEGDTFSIYGNEYAIDSSGHIHVSVDDTFTSTEVKYPKRTM